MRTINKSLKKVYFRTMDDTRHGIHDIIPGVERVFWNTEKRSIAAKITRPLLFAITPRKWAQLAHEDRPEDAWLC